MEQTSALVPIPKRTLDGIGGKIWNEMYSAKKNDLYIAEYLRFLRSRKKEIRLYTIGIAILFILINNWIPNVAVIGLSGLALFEILKEIIPAVTVDDNLLDRLPEYRMLYVQKFQKLHSLYHKVEEEIITPEDADKEYFEIKDALDLRIEEIDNAIHFPDKLNLKSNADKRTDVYMNNIYRHLENG